MIKILCLKAKVFLLTCQFMVDGLIIPIVVSTLHLFIGHELNGAVRDAPQTGDETSVKRIKLCSISFGYWTPWVLTCKGPWSLLLSIFLLERLSCPCKSENCSRPFLRRIVNTALKTKGKSFQLKGGLRIEFEDWPRFHYPNGIRHSQSEDTSLASRQHVVGGTQLDLGVEWPDLVSFFSRSGRNFIESGDITC